MTVCTILMAVDRIKAARPSSAILVLANQTIHGEVIPVSKSLKVETVFSDTEMTKKWIAENKDNPNIIGIFDNWYFFDAKESNLRKLVADKLS